MNNAQLINQDSGNYEYYTPIEIVEAAREVMGSIDLDPFSSYAANPRVKASEYYDVLDNGLNQKWFQPLLDFPQCYLSPRTNYYLPDGTKKTGVTKGSVVTYLGDNVDKFKEVFDGKFGKVKI